MSIDSLDEVSDDIRAHFQWLQETQIWNGRSVSKKMKRIIITSILIMLTGCSIENPNKATQTSLELRHQVASQLKKELDLVPIGIGGNRKDKKWSRLGLIFKYEKPIEDVSTGRRILAIAVKRFLDTINQNTYIRKFLIEYPFKAQNITISILVQSKKGLRFDPPSFLFVDAENGFFKYMIASEKEQIKTIYEETYEQALKELEIENITGYWK